MYRKILAPLDGSELAECTLTHVATIAKGCQVPEVVLLRVIEPLNMLYEVSEETISKLKETAEADSRDYLAKSADSLKKAGISSVSTDVLTGKPAKMILDYARKKKADLIVMSTNGRSGVSRWMLGSVTDKVVRQSPIPVLTVSPPGCRSKVYKVGFEASAE